LARSVIRRIFLARCIVHTPRLIVLDDFLDAFSHDERPDLIAALTDPSAPWTLVAVSRDPQFKQQSTLSIQMREGKAHVERLAPPSPNALNS